MKNITYSSKKQKPRYLGISLFDDIYIYKNHMSALHLV